MKLFFAFLLIASYLVARAEQKPSWAYVLKGFQDVDVSGIKTDAQGNVYACGTYSGWMEVPGNKERFKAPNHCGGFLVKVSKEGKTLWALPFISANDSRLTSLDLTPQGGVAVVGFLDSGLIIPSVNGKTKKQEQGYGSFIATYSGEGNLLWAHSQHGTWAEGTALAIDKTGNLYYAGYFTKGFMGKGIVKSDSVNQTSEFLIKYAPDGEISWQKYFKANSAFYSYTKKPKIYISPSQELYFFSVLTKGEVDIYSETEVTKLKSVNNHSAYVIVFEPDGKINWVKHFGGKWANQISAADFDQQGNVHVITQFGYEFYIGNDDVSSNEASSSKPLGASSGIAWFALDNTGRLIDVKYQVEVTGCHGTAGCFVNVLPNGQKIIGGSFTNKLNFKRTDGQVKSISGLPCNHNSWVGLFDEQSEIVDLWNGVNTQVSFSVATHASFNNKYHSIAYMCHEDQEVELKNKLLKVPKAERARFTIITSGEIEMEEKSPAFQQLVSCSELKLKRELKNIGMLTASIDSLFSEDRNVRGNWTTGANNTVSIDSVIHASASRALPFVEAQLFPNPAREQVRLTMTSTASLLTFSLYTLSGCLLLTDIRQAEDKQFDVALNISNLAAGVYLLVCESGSYRKVFRLVHVD